MDCQDPLAVQGTLKSLLQHLLQHKLFTGQKHLFFSMQLSLQSTSNIHTFGFEYPMNTCIHMFVCKYASSLPLSVQLGAVWWVHMITGVNTFRTYQTVLIHTHTQIYICIYVCVNVYFTLLALSYSRCYLQSSSQTRVLTLINGIQFPDQRNEPMNAQYSLLRVMHSMYTNVVTDSFKQFQTLCLEFSICKY